MHILITLEDYLSYLRTCCHTRINFVLPRTPVCIVLWSTSTIQYRQDPTWYSEYYLPRRLAVQSDSHRCIMYCIIYDTVCIHSSTWYSSVVCHERNLWYYYRRCWYYDTVVLSTPASSTKFSCMKKTESVSSFRNAPVLNRFLYHFSKFRNLELSIIKRLKVCCFVKGVSHEKLIQLPSRAQRRCNRNACWTTHDKATSDPIMWRTKRKLAEHGRALQWPSSQPVTLICKN